MSSSCGKVALQQGFAARQSPRPAARVSTCNRGRLSQVSLSGFSHLFIGATEAPRQGRLQATLTRYAIATAGQLAAALCQGRCSTFAFRCYGGHQLRLLALASLYANTGADPHPPPTRTNRNTQAVSINHKMAENDSFTSNPTSAEAPVLWEALAPHDLFTSPTPR